MKNKLPIVFLFIIIIFFFGSFYFWREEKTNEKSLVHDVSEEVVINKNKLYVHYKKGNMMDEVLTFGNQVTKVIAIENKSDELISYALSLTESEMTLNSLTYSVSFSDTLDGKYVSTVRDKSINEDKVLVYDLGIEAGKMQYIKVELKANLEGVETTLKGVLKVVSNLSEKDVFLQKMDSIYEALQENIKKINGINEAGFFIQDIEALSFEEKEDYRGYILIDASDYSSLKYYFSVYTNKFMLYHKEYPEEVNKGNIRDYNHETITFEGICRERTKKDCRLFSDLKYRSDGGEDNFVVNVNKVIASVQNHFHNKSANVYIYDVKSDIQNDTNVRGYILINNQSVNKPEYYLYLTNDLYMISGYNLTKLGNINASSATIRAYNEMAFKLSSESMNKVCTFSGFGECYTIRDEKV